MQTLSLHPYFICPFARHFLFVGPVDTENIVRHLFRQPFCPVEECLRGKFSPLHACQPGFPAGSERGVCDFHSPDGFVDVQPLACGDDVTSRIADVLAVDKQIASDVHEGLQKCVL